MDIVERLRAMTFEEFDEWPTASEKLCNEATALIASQAARIRELEEGLVWAEPAMYALTSYEKDRGEPLPADHQIGKIDDSRNSASFRLYVGHIRRMASLLSRKGGE